MAFYAPSSDHIQMPPIESIRDTDSYVAVRAHETVHYAAFRIMPRRCAFPWTGEQHRRGMSA
jgi:antirestriction protein ArdC